MHGAADVLMVLSAIAASSDDRAKRAKEAAEEIRRARGFHWVGLYDVTPSAISAIAWTGTAAPAFPVFPRTQGLNGAAVAEQRPIVINVDALGTIGFVGRAFQARLANPKGSRHGIEIRARSA